MNHLTEQSSSMTPSPLRGAAHERAAAVYHDDIDRRTTFYPADPIRGLQHAQARELVAECGHNLLEVVPVSEELEQVIRCLDEALMWANAAIARNADA